MLLEPIFFSKIWHFLFWWETLRNRKIVKKFIKMSQSLKISTKKSLVTPEQKMSEKIQKVDPPPLPKKKKKKGPFFLGGGECF